MNVCNQALALEGGMTVRANTPLITADMAPSMNAGKFPSPNTLSNGPLISDTNICMKQKNRTRDIK